MEYTPEQKSKIDYFRSSVRLQSPDSESDPDYKYSDDDLWAILEAVVPSHNPKYTINTLPQTEFNFAILLAKKELYYRLATSTAPFYPLSAEGAELKKNVRFDHYLALVKQVTSDYSSSLAIFNNSYFGEMQTYNVTSQSDYFKRRYTDFASSPKVVLQASGITTHSVNLDWEKFNAQLGIFSAYEIYVESKPVFDEYAENTQRPNTRPKISLSDIHKVKYRVDKLSPDTTYFISVKTITRNGMYGYAEMEIRTLPII